MGVVKPHQSDMVTRGSAGREKSCMMSYSSACLPACLSVAACINKLTCAALSPGWLRNVSTLFCKLQISNTWLCKHGSQKILAWFHPKIAYLDDNQTSCTLLIKLEHLSLDIYHEKERCPYSNNDIFINTGVFYPPFNASQLLTWVYTTPLSLYSNETRQYLYWQEPEWVKQCLHFTLSGYA